MIVNEYEDRIINLGLQRAWVTRKEIRYQFLKGISNKAAYFSTVLIWNITDPLMKWNKLWKSSPDHKFCLFIKWPEGLTADVISDKEPNQDPCSKSKL